MKTRWCLPLLLFAAVRLWAGPEMEFVGVLAAGGETKVFLTDKTTGQSRWVKVGLEFGGFVVSAYEAATEVVVLTQGAQQFRVPLKTAKTHAGAVEPSPEIKKAILNNLRMLSAASDQYYLENGVTRTTYDALVGPTKYIKQINVADGEDYRSVELAQGKKLIVTTAGGYTTTYAP